MINNKLKIEGTKIFNYLRSKVNNLKENNPKTKVVALNIKIEEIDILLNYVRELMIEEDIYNASYKCKNISFI